MVAWVRHELTRLGHFLAHGGVWWGLGLSVVLAIGSLAIATAVVVGWAPNLFTHGPPPGHKHLVMVTVCNVMAASYHHHGPRKAPIGRRNSFYYFARPRLRAPGPSGGQ